MRKQRERRKTDRGIGKEGGGDRERKERERGRDMGGDRQTKREKQRDRSFQG